MSRFNNFLFRSTLFPSASCWIFFVFFSQASLPFLSCCHRTTTTTTTLSEDEYLFRQVVHPLPSPFEFTDKFIFLIVLFSSIFSFTPSNFPGASWGIPYISSLASLPFLSNFPGSSRSISLHFFPGFLAIFEQTSKRMHCSIMTHQCGTEQFLLLTANRHLESF